LPALDPSQFAPTVNVGVSPQTQQFAMLGLLGLGALFLFSRKR
jgi:MYXO-CTERM domain-containing protein